MVNINENLSSLEQDVLKVLIMLERPCDVAVIDNRKHEDFKKDKVFYIASFHPSGKGTIDFSSLNNSEDEDIDNISKYLFNKGLDFDYPRIDIMYYFDEEREYHSMTSEDKKKEADLSVKFPLIFPPLTQYRGQLIRIFDPPPITIKGESLEAIQAKIKELIDELQSKKSRQENSVKRSASVSNNKDITHLELLEDKAENQRITVYINKNYNAPMRRGRGIFWGTMYNLAKEQKIPYERGFFNYFNSNSTNPLYAGAGFHITKILAQEYEKIVPAIKIGIITQKKVSQALNSA